MRTIRFILEDTEMPKSIYWQNVLDILQKHTEENHNNFDICIPSEDIAAETNWPKYSKFEENHIRHPERHFADNRNSNLLVDYLNKVFHFADTNPLNKILLLNMNPFMRIPFYARNYPNIYIADGSLALFERQLNPRTISLPALPFSTGSSQPLSERSILASFQGVLSHETRKALASAADGKEVIVNLVERSHHVGKIAAGTKTDMCYEQLLKNSIFAFVPRGDALFSYRLLEVMSFGCIPIILSDGWVLPFDRTVPWNDFSLNFHYDSIAFIPGLLKNLSKDEIQARHKKVTEVYNKHFRSLDRIIESVFTEFDLIHSK